MVEAWPPALVPRVSTLRAVGGTVVCFGETFGADGATG